MRKLAVLAFFTILMASCCFCAQKDKEPDSKPLRLLKEYLAKDTCSCCGNTFPWKIIEIQHEFLAKHIRDCKFFIADWICCQDRPIASRILGVCNSDDRAFPVRKASDLVPHLVSVNNEDNCLEVAGIIISLTAGVGCDPTLAIEISSKGLVKKMDGCFVVRRRDTNEEWIVEFDVKGRVKNLTYVIRGQKYNLG